VERKGFDTDSICGLVSLRFLIDFAADDLITSDYSKICDMGVWERVAMDSLKYHYGPPCPTLLRPAGGNPMPYASVWTAMLMNMVETKAFKMTMHYGLEYILFR
jgi:hypothetical protein